MSRFLGALTGFVFYESMMHISHAHAMTLLKAETLPERLSALLFGILLLLVLMVVFHRMFSRSFFFGFVTAVGLFFSIDIVLFHWIFKLHRITSGPEANVLEPIFVFFGIGFTWYGINGERKFKQASKGTFSRD